MNSQTHQLIVAYDGQSKVRGEVVRMAKAAGQPGDMSLTLRTDIWLNFGTYAATYITPRQSLHGHYEVWETTLESDEDFIISGLFHHT